MRKVTSENESQAHAAGRAAADKGENCVPAHCSIFRSIIADFKVGDGAAHIAHRWIEGWRERKAEQILSQAA